MRNLKKLLAVVVTIAMIATFAIPAFAAETKTEAQIVTDLGMLKGAGAGVTAEYLATQPDRLQAAILFLRLLGKEAEAKAFTGTDNFSDVAGLSAENTAILAYLKANPDLGYGGIGGDKFDPLTKMTAKAYYKVVLVALGYAYGTDFTWENVMSFAAGKGLTKNIDVETFTVNDLAVATVEALRATVKGGTETLIAKLVAAGTVASADAVAAGIYTVPVIALKVDDVTADNCKEIVVNFNKVVDADTAEDTANYLIDDEDLQADDEVALNDDGKSVTITFDAAWENGDNFDLTVSGVLDSAGVEMDEQTVSVTIADVTAPKATDIELTGPNTFKITFSEPMSDDPDLMGTVTVADDEYGVSVAETDGTNEMEVTLSDSELAAGDYEVVVEDYKDFAGHKIADTTFTLKYVIDKTAPVAKITSATQTEVVIEFNEKVYNGDPDDNQPLINEFFYHTANRDIYWPAVFEADEDADGYVAPGDTEYTLDFSENPLPEGPVKIGIVYDADGTITDAWGNEMTADQILNTTVTADTTKPTVTKVEMGDDNFTVNVFFSEEVSDTAEDSDNYVFKNSDGDELDIDEIAAVDQNEDDEWFVAITMEEEMSGENTVEISGVEDVAVDPNEMDKVTKSVEADDETAPDLTEVTATAVDDTTKDYIYVSYPEDMATTGNYSVLDKDRYNIYIDNDDSGTYSAGDDVVELDDADTIVTFNGDDAVKITIQNEDLYQVDGGVLNSLEDLDEDDVLEIGHPVGLLIEKMADAAGNVSSIVTTAVPVTTNLAPTLASVKTIDEKTIEITIDGELKTVVASGFEVRDDSDVGDEYATLSSIKSWKIDDGDTIITGILKAAQQLDDSADTGITVRVVDDKLKSTTGLVMEAAGNVVNAAAVEDGFAPSLVDDGIAVGDIVYDDSEEDDPLLTATFTITLDEDLLADSEELAAQDLVITNSDGDELVAGEDYTTTIAGAVITVTVTDGIDGMNWLKVKSVDPIKYIKDDPLVGDPNKANAFTDLVKLDFDDFDHIAG